MIINTDFTHYMTTGYMPKNDSKPFSANILSKFKFKKLKKGPHSVLHVKHSGLSPASAHAVIRRICLTVTLQQKHISYPFHTSQKTHLDLLTSGFCV